VVAGASVVAADSLAASDSGSSSLAHAAPISPNASTDARSRRFVRCAMVGLRAARRAEMLLWLMFTLFASRSCAGSTQPRMTAAAAVVDLRPGEAHHRRADFQITFSGAEPVCAPSVVGPSGVSFPCGDDRL